MKTLETITAIVDALTETEFKAICSAENDYWELDARTSRNGYKRMVYHLRKAGLTVEDWWLWCE
jgi:hypothetical protein